MAEKSTTKEALKKLDARLECSLCLNTFKKPKLLPCFHVFCESCLEKLVVKDGESLCCPICRNIVPLSAKGVAGLQTDFHVDCLFEIRDAFGKSEESIETKCGNCENEIASGYCRDCGEYVCGDCQNAHGKLKLTKFHKIITLKEVQTTTFCRHEMSVSCCSKHSDKSLSLFCETCSVLICSHCTFQLHQGHNYDLVADIFPKHREEIVSSLKPVKEKLDKIQGTLKAFDTRVKEIDDQRATLEADIHKEIDQQYQFLDQRRVELVGELDMLTRRKLKSLAAQRNQVEIAEGKLTSCLEYAEGGLETGNEGQVLAMKGPMLKRIKQISTEFDLDTIQPETEADIRLLTDGKEQFQQTCQEFLEICEGEESLCIENSHTTGDGLKGATIREKKAVIFQAMTKQDKKFKGKLNLTAKLIHTKSINRAKCKVVKRQNGQYDINYQPVKRGKHELHLTVNGNPVPGSPYSIAVTPSQQSLCNPIRVIQGLDEPRGSAVNSKGQIVIVDGKGTTISVLSPEGRPVFTLGMYGSGSGNGQFSNAYGVTVDKDDNIYVSDYGNHRIQKFKSKGEFSGTVGRLGIQHLQFNNPVGICYNHRDNNLYIPDQLNHRIQVLSTGLEFVRCFGTEGSGIGQLRNPLSCAFDDNCSLYVTDCYNNRVQVFTAEGQFLRMFTTERMLKNPLAIAIDSSNTVYISEEANGSLSIFTSQGNFITFFATSRAGGQFTSIYGLSIDSNDAVIISDRHEKRLEVY